MLRGECRDVLPAPFVLGWLSSTMPQPGHRRIIESRPFRVKRKMPQVGPFVLEPRAVDPVWFPERLKELRQEKGLTQKELAERAGVSPRAVAKWEQGDREPAWSFAIML